MHCLIGSGARRSEPEGCFWASTKNLPLWYGSNSLGEVDSRNLEIQWNSDPFELSHLELQVFFVKEQVVLSGITDTKKRLRYFLLTKKMMRSKLNWPLWNGHPMARTFCSALWTVRQDVFVRRWRCINHDVNSGCWESPRLYWSQVHVYDNEGIYSHKVPIYCLPRLVLEWMYDIYGTHHLGSGSAPTSCW